MHTHNKKQHIPNVVIRATNFKDVIHKQDKVLVFVNAVRLNFKKECDKKTNLTKYLTAEIASLKRVYKSITISTCIE